MTQSTDNKVVTLVPNRGLAPDLDVMADKLEQFATRIRAGEWPRLRHVLILLNDTDEVHTPWCYGQPINGGELVGVMEWIKAKVIRGEA